MSTCRQHYQPKYWYSLQSCNAPKCPTALLHNQHQAPKTKVINASIDLKIWEDSSQNLQNSLMKMFSDTNQRHDNRHAGESIVECASYEFPQNNEGRCIIHPELTGD